MEWERKTVTREGVRQVELRAGARGGRVLIVVGLDGYNHKWYKVKPPRPYNESTKGLNIHLATAGGLQLTFAEWNDLTVQVALAEQELRMENRIV